MSELPEPWRRAAEQAGLRQTFHGIAGEADVSHTTVRRMVLGIGVPSASSIAAVSKALRRDVSPWLGRKPTGEPYVGPDSSRHLSERQRLALTELINALLEVEDETDAHSAEAEEKRLDMTRLRAAAEAAWIVEPGGGPAGASVAPLHPKTPLKRAARRRTSPRTPTPDLDGQDLAGEENQDA